MPSYSVDLRLVDTTYESIDGVSVRRTLFRIENPSGITSAKLFIVQNAPTPENPERVEYRTVATAADIINLNEDAPSGENLAEPYRVAEVTVYTDNPQAQFKFVNDVLRRLKTCLAGAKQLDTDETEVVYTVSLD